MLWLFDRFRFLDLERYPAPLVFVGMFVALAVFFTCVAHYLPREGHWPALPPLAWPAACAEGVLSACACTSLVFWASRRERD